MSFLNNKKLYFFNDKGEDLNFSYNQEKGYYEGNIYLPLISTFLINKLNIFMFEEFNVNGEIEYGQIQDEQGVTNETLIRSEFDDTEDLNWKFYDFEEEGELKVFTESQQQFNSTDVDNKVIGSSNGIATTNAVDSSSIKIKVAFSSAQEGSYRNNLIIKAIKSNSETFTIADISLYTEVEEEDERLGTLINNFYADVAVDQQDFFIFRDTDIKEGYPDWRNINAKLKELLLSGRYLKNYQGSYRGLITAIRYFGYDSLRINEYFKNVNEDSPNFGKKKFKEISSQFDGVIDPFYNSETNLPNKFWKKTSEMGLAYDLNKIVKDEFDEFGLPIVEDAFDFTNEEILIKLQGLKNKLKSKFLPLSSRIISITGEGNYFARYDLNTWNEAYRTDKINVSRETSFDYFPKKQGFIINLNQLLVELDSVVKQEGNMFIVGEDQINYNTATYNNIIPLSKKAIKINSVSVNGNDFFVKGVDYTLVNDGNDVQWISDSFELNDSDIIVLNYEYSALETPISEWNPNPSVPYSQLKTDIVNQNIILDSKYTQTFVQYIVNKISSAYYLNDSENTPVGCPLSLTNTSFELLWSEADIDWEDANEGVNGNNTTWDSVKYESYYEIEWIITKLQTADDNREWEYRLRGNVQQYESINLILPYDGDYEINMILYNTFNASTTRTEILNVEQKNPDLVGNYKAFQTTYTWSELADQSWRDVQYNWAVNLQGGLDWDGATVSWRNTDKINYSNKRIYNDLEKYSIENIKFANWNELSHLWWEGARDTVAYNPYTWYTKGLKNWDGYYKNETWDGVQLASDSPAFFEILSIEPDSVLKLGDRVEKTYVEEGEDEDDPDVIKLYKYLYTRFTNPKTHPEGNLLFVKDSLGDTLLTISRDGNNYITGFNNTTIERGNKELIFPIGNKKTSNIEYDGINILDNQLYVDEIIILKLNGIKLFKTDDYTFDKINQEITFITQVNNGDLIELEYYTPEETKFLPKTTTNFGNSVNSTIQINDTDFINSLNIGFDIILRINASGNTLNLVRRIEEINGSEIVYSGGNRGNIIELVNINVYETIIRNTQYPPFKDRFYRELNELLSKYDTVLQSTQSESQVYTVEGNELIFSSDANDLEIAYQQLLNTDLPHFKRFNWNIIYNEDEVTPNRIQATSKLFGEGQETWIDVEGIKTELHAPAITLNYDWNELRVFSRRTEIPLYTQIIFTYGNSKMPGKQRSGDWEIIHPETNEINTLSEDAFSYFFDKKGEYIIKLTLYDSNGNQKTCTKQGIVLVK